MAELFLHDFHGCWRYPSGEASCRNARITSETINSLENITSIRHLLVAAYLSGLDVAS